jgi:hypothetical protein
LLKKRHGASGNNGDDGVRALLAFARDSDLIASGADDADAALIFLFQCGAKGVGSLLLDELSKVLNLFIGGVLRDTKIKPPGWALAGLPLKIISQYRARASGCMLAPLLGQIGHSP